MSLTDPQITLPEFLRSKRGPSFWSTLPGEVRVILGLILLVPFSFLVALEWGVAATFGTEEGWLIVTAIAGLLLFLGGEVAQRRLRTAWMKDASREAREAVLLSSSSAALVWAGGLLLICPGMVTDATGLLLLVPGIHGPAARWVLGSILDES